MSERSDRIGRLLNERGFSVTPGRRAVVDVIADRDTVFTANDVVTWVDAVDPRIGRATVFRTLDLLSEVNVLTRVHSEDGCHSYTICETGHHHHLVCSRCHKVVPVEQCNIDDEVARVAQQSGFAIENHRIEFFGLCPACQAIR